MGFFEAVIALTAILAVFIGLPWFTFQGILKVKNANASGNAKEMRRSDLEALVSSAVEDATAPLLRRIETLEAIAIDEDAAQGRLDAAVLADALEDVDDGYGEVGLGRRRARS